MRAAVLLLLTSAALGQAAGVTGLWVGTARRDQRTVPFELQVTESGAGLRAAFVNGPARSAAYPATFSGGRLVVNVSDYANQLDATVQGATLNGTFGGHARPMAVSASRVPAIAGDWQISVHGPKGEDRWALQVHQDGASVSAVILRIDGDTGTLYGSYTGGAFVLHRFTGAGGSTLTLEPLPDGTLRVGSWIARRAASAHPAELAPADDPLTHTRLADPHQPLQFRFRDLAGDWVASTDVRFRGKVVIVAIGGSWCPNCHDEAPFLEALYRRYHARGLDIVYLDFEDAPQLANPTRLRAFIRRYGLTFPVLLAGRTDQLDAALPQVENLNCWPTMFIIGRDGMVKRIHAGFASAATGLVHAQLVADTTQLLQALLMSPPQPRGRMAHGLRPAH